MSAFICKRVLLEYLRTRFFSNMSFENFIDFGRQNGYLEESDLSTMNAPFSRVDAARIIHNLLKYKEVISDETSIENAYVLSDIFDCHLCVNHIAQMYLNNVMPAKEGVDAKGNTFLYFGNKDNVEFREFMGIKRNIESL